MSRSYLAVLVSWLIGLGIHDHLQSSSVSALRCSTFAIDLPGVNLSSTKYYAANAIVDIRNSFQDIDRHDLPGFCRAELTIITNETAGSTCGTEVWLPDAWNGRFVAFGNGGYAGGVAVGELGSIAIPQGFAGVSTDTGHTSDVSSADWAGPGNDNAIVDWSWRAMHLSIVTGKEVVKQYYGQAHNKSYYMGCSIGGRQGLKEVQTFPEDFDGVIVGSPANWQTHLQAWGVHMDVEVLPANSSRFIKASLWDNVIHPEVLRQCDALDGLKDYIISDPRYCIFRPETLTCRPGQNVSTCLTIPQIDALHHLYADYYETNQTWIFGGYVPGGEKAYPHGYIRDKPFAVAEEWFQYFVLNDTKWTINQYDASLVWLSDTIDPGQANAISPNLTAFAGPKHNGKLLHYVGWADQIISPGSSLHYYETVHAFTRANTDMNIDDFYRLFTVAGMNHCEGGYGGNAFGGVQQTSDDMPPLSLDPEHNILAAMVQWVENGTAPSSVIGVHWKNNTAKDGVGFTRPLCQYPKTLRYTGSDPSSAESFSCV